MKKLLILFTVTLISLCLYGQTAVAPTVGDGSVENPYQIANLENLYWITADDSEVSEPDQVSRWSAYYIQVADIDASVTNDWFEGQGWRPIGSYISSSDNIPFSGSYNGQNYSISNLYINRDEDYIGMFGYIYEAFLQNIELTSIEISGLNNVGGLVGHIRHFANIKNCIISGTVEGFNSVGLLVGYSNLSSLNIRYCVTSGSVNGNNMIGGLVGQSRGGIIRDCHSSADVTGIDRVGGLIGERGDIPSSIISSNSSGNVFGSNRVGGLVGNNGSHTGIFNSYSNSTVQGSEFVGGLVGHNFFSCQIQNSYSSGVVTGITSVGGLIGRNYDSIMVIQSYSTGDVSGEENVGGLVGSHRRGDIEDCYSRSNVVGDENVGGLIGKALLGHQIKRSYSTGSVTGSIHTGGLVGSCTNTYQNNNYWDTETSSQDSSAIGYGRTTQDMTFFYSTDTYVDWDFIEIWQTDEDYSLNDGYPYLFWQIEPNPPAHAIDPIPENNTVNIPINTEFGWTYTSQDGYSDPDAFLFKIWTSETEISPFEKYINGGPGTYLIDNISFDLEFNQEYYWQIIPLLSFDQIYIYAENCPVWTFTTESEATTEIFPSTFSTNLINNYPNPFNPETRIEFSLETPAKVTMTIYNIKGQQIRKFNNHYEAGIHNLIWDGKSDSGTVCGSGVYFYRMQTENYSSLKKMILLK